MYKLTSAFIYQNQKTFLHLLDPRIKLVMVMSFFIISMLSHSLAIQLFLISFEIGISYLANISKRWFRSLLTILPFFIMIFSVNYFLGGGLLESLIPSIRLISMVGIFSLFFISTPPDIFALMLKKLGFPQMISLAFSMALRFIPVLAQQTEDIMNAQKARGLSIESKNPIKRIKNLIPILIPIIILSIKRSIEIAEALEVRAFDIKKPRSSYIELKLKTNDGLFLLMILGLTAGLIYFNISYVPDDFLLNMFSNIH